MLMNRWVIGVMSLALSAMAAAGPAVTDGSGKSEKPLDLTVRVRGAAVRSSIAPGGSIALPGGTLVYEGLRTWMGYRVSHDPTLPWLLAASLLAALAMAWHYAAAFMRRSRTTTNPAATTNVARGIA